jgi:hypothetical protein
MGSALFSCHSSLSRWQEYEAIYLKVRAHYPLSRNMSLKIDAFERYLRPSTRGSFTRYGRAMIQSGKPLALVDHVETLHSFNDASCHYQKLPSTHTTYGQPPTLTNACIINNEALCCHPPGLRNIIRSLQDPTSAKNVHTPLATGTTRINTLLTNLRHSATDPSYITFDDATVSWYNKLLLHRHYATDTDTTGTENKIFQAFDVTSPTHYST